MDILEANGNFTLNEDINGPVLSTFIALEMVTGFVANLFVIIVTFCHPKSLKQPSTIFLTSLLLADLVVVVFVMSFNVIATASGGWIFGQSVEEKYGVCQFVGFMFWYATNLVLTTLAIVSFDRCLSIVKPFIHKQYMKPHTAVIIIVITWIICAMLSTAPLYGFGRFVYSKNQGTCVPEWTAFYLIVSVLICVTMMGIIVVTSIWTCCFTRRFLQQNQTDNNNIYVSKNRRVIGIFGSLLLACALCFGPGKLTTFIYIFYIYIPYLSIFSAFCFYFITIANPLVQSFFRPDIRDTVKYMFSKCSSHTLSTSDTVRNQQTIKTSSTAA